MALMIWPGVQKPHCRPSWAMNASCTGCSLSALRHAFDREDIGAVVTDRERKARIDPPSVDDDGAGAALAAVAALLGSGQIQPLAQQIEQRDAGVIERDRPLHAVHGESR